MAGKGGGAWKVAYADFVTAMMAFFMVMWLVSQKPDVKQAVAEYFRNPAGKNLAGNPNRSVLPNQNDSSGGRRNRARGKEPPQSQTKMLDEGKRTNVGTMIKFDANSVELNDEARQRIDDMLPELKGKPHRIEVRGHALDDGGRDPQSLSHAFEISYRRAIAAMQYLIEQGIEPERVRLSQGGASEPRYAGEEIDVSANARVELYFIEETYESPKRALERMVSTPTAEPTADELAEAMKGALPTGAEADAHGAKGH